MVKQKARKQPNSHSVAELHFEQVGVVCFILAISISGWSRISRLRLQQHLHTEKTTCDCVSESRRAGCSILSQQHKFMLCERLSRAPVKAENIPFVRDVALSEPVVGLVNIQL